MRCRRTGFGSGDMARRASFGGMTVGDMVGLIRDQTRPESAPLTPELKMHMASAITPLWRATEATLEKTGMPPPYWAFAWPGSQAIARLVLDSPALVRGRRVLDFAAGGGLIAMACARMGAARVIAVDIDPIAEVALALNAKLNRLAIQTSHHDIVGQALREIDLVLAGDVFYERALAQRILPWFHQLAKAGKTVLVGDPGRAYLPSTGIEPIATYTVPTSMELEDRETKDTTVWKVLAD